ncbi:hypothetical protein I4U23_011709 [Adineta vaga]|nr:hypothetical protein I4U23_011709 [Adineta vaga]
MATANNTTQCFKCLKYKKITTLCKGCLKEFCQTDWSEHYQVLNEELHSIINDYDQFRHTINDQKQNPINHSLIKQIDQWETNSIQIIQQTAEKCRQSVVEHYKTSFEDTEQNLNELSKQIKEIQRENEFNEIDLNDLKEKLRKMSEQLNNPSNISIQKHRQGYIKEISVISRKETKFQQNGIIVAGGNGHGRQLNQLSYPQGIFVDENKTIFIADLANHRIVKWKCDGKQGQIIAGGNGHGERIDQLNNPLDVIVDQKNHSIIIADGENRRVMQWSRDQQQQILIQNISCFGLTMDQHGFIYVSDWEKNEVRKWKLENINEKKEGTSVAGGNGEGSQLNPLCRPQGIFVDKDQSLYVSDCLNHRVMKWRKDAREGVVVAGGNGEGNNLNQLNQPVGLFVDEWNQIYVADWKNHRIMRWCEGDEEGSIAVGGNGRGSESNQLNRPIGLSFDFEGNLYVSDCVNHRIVRFDKIH